MKKSLFTLLFAFFSISLFAEPVTLDAVRKVAVNYYKHYAAAKTNDFTIDNVLANTYQGQTTFYVVTFTSGGFVMVAADDAVIPVLGYSITDTYSANNLPDNMREWLDGYNHEIVNIIQSNYNNTETSMQWDAIKSNEFSKTGDAVAPILTTTWDQGQFYNASCPADGGGPAGHVYTGCVATAMAQIMKRWNYPTTGLGSHSYVSSYGTLTANFGGTTYNWGSMPNNVTSSNPAVATIMYHAGVSVDMNYSPSGSGAYSWDVPTALINYFNYETSAEIQFKSDYATNDWIALLKAELDAGRVVYYSGDNGSAGHAFVCDGYDNSNNFHFNWGWSGYANGYFAIGNLNPGGYNFSQNNSAVIRIHPPNGSPIANFGANTTTPGIGAPVTFTDYSTNSPTTWSWSFPGGTPSSSALQVPPTVSYSTAGYKLVILTVSNGNGSDTKTKTAYINVGGTPSAWIKQNSGFSSVSRGIDQIAIVNPFVVWAKAYDGTAPTNYIREFTRTINGGSSWMPGSIVFSGSTSYGVSNIFPLNDTACFACMFPISGTGGVIAKTTNGGSTWITTGSPAFTNSWADFVHFFNATEGVCMGDPTGSGGDFAIYTTTNGGTSWTQVPGANIPNATTTEAGITNMYDAVGNTVWFGTTFGNIYKSTDKGLNWTKTASGFGSSAVVTPTFKDANTGIITATNNSTGAYIGMKRTTNGGSNWTTVTPTGFYVKYPHLDYIPGTASTWVDVAAGPGKGSSYSLNDCSSFVNIDTGSTQYTTTTFYDINTGWAGGFNVSSTDGGIWKWDNPIIVGVDKPQINKDNLVSLYPNPTNGILTLQLNTEVNDGLIFKLCNLLGEVVFEQDNLDFHGFSSKQINLQSISNGIYLVTVQSNKINYSTKIIIQQ